ncbi:thioesterase [Herbaspirillum sp. HC18]|nr:thioesterase [Herbaspirillum sp. HC18]
MNWRTEPRAARNCCMRWLKRNTSAQMQLVCFPNAGAGASIFNQWSAWLHGDVDIGAIQLPRREDRFSEPPFRKLTDAANHIAGEMALAIDIQSTSRPLVLFGHSMGALLAYETALTLRDLHGVQLHGVILSGRGAPDTATSIQRCRHDASDEMLLSDLARLGGTPRVLLEDCAFMAAYLPIIRADYEMLDTYLWSRRAPLSCPVVVYAGRQDTEVSRDAIAGWKKHAAGSYCERWFDGGHFYLFERPQECVSQLIRDAVRIVFSQESCT